MYTRVTDHQRVAGHKAYVDDLLIDDTSRVCTLTSIKSGQSNPGYRDKIAAGVQAGSEYKLDVYSNVSLERGQASLTLSYSGAPQGRETRTFDGVLRVPSGNKWDFPHPVFYSSTELDALAITRLHNQLRNQRSHTNAMVTLGELGEAVRMIRRPAEALRVGALGLARQLTKRRKEPGHARRTAEEWRKIVAGTILEVNFGWAPTLADVRGTAEAVARFHYPPVVTDRHRGTAKLAGSGVSSNLEQVAPTYPLSLMLAQVEQTWKSEVIYSYVSGSRLQQTASSSFERLRTVLGFTPENLLPTLYNLTPWSWLVDYFSNLGDVVSCFSTDTSDVNWLVRTVTQKTTRRVASRRTADWVQALYLDPTILRAYSGHFGAYEVTRTTVSRTLPNGVPMPTLQFSLPGSSGTKWWNIAAVLSGLFKP